MREEEIFFEGSNTIINFVIQIYLAIKLFWAPRIEVVYIIKLFIMMKSSSKSTLECLRKYIFDSLHCTFMDNTREESGH